MKINVYAIFSEKLTQNLLKTYLINKPLPI